MFQEGDESLDPVSGPTLRYGEREYNGFVPEIAGHTLPSASSDIDDSLKSRSRGHSLDTSA